MTSVDGVRIDEQHPPTASAVVYKKEDKVIAKKWLEQRDRWVTLAKGEAGVDDAKVIQSAIDEIYNSGGGVIRICKGKYYLNNYVALKDNIKIVGEGDKTILYQPPYNGQAIFAIHGRKNITIENIVLDGYKADLTGHTIYIENSENITIRGCKFRVKRVGHCFVAFVKGGKKLKLLFNEFDASVSGDKQDIVAGVPDDSLIIGNYFHDSLGAGITTGRTSNTIYAFNIFRNISQKPDYAGFGITIEMATVTETTESKNVLILGNIIVNDNPVYGGGILLNAKSDDIFENIKIVGNIIVNFYDPDGVNKGGRGIYVEGSASSQNVEIVGNTIMNIGGIGIEVKNYDGAFIANNYVKNTGLSPKYDLPWDSGAILVWSGNIGKIQTTIIGNRVDSKYGIYLGRYGSDNKVVNSLVADNHILSIGSGIKDIYGFDLGGGYYYNPVPDGNVFKDNKTINFHFHNSGTATFSGDGSTTQFKIEHGLVSTPDKGKTRVWALSADAADNFWIDVDDTYIYVNYKTAPPSGTDNVVLGWYAEV